MGRKEHGVRERGIDLKWVNNEKEDRRKGGQRRRKGRHNGKDEINRLVKEIGCGWERGGGREGVRE